MSNTIKHAIDGFLLNCKVEGKSWGTIDCYADKLKGFHNATLPKTIKDLAIPAMNWDLNAFYNWLITNPTDKSR